MFERAGAELEAAQAALNQLRVQNSSEQAFLLLNRAQRHVTELSRLVEGLNGDMRVVWSRWVLRRPTPPLLQST